MRKALGMIECIGLTPAITALDSACKAADVILIGYDKVIGVDKSISVTIHIAGDVAAVDAAVHAGVMAGSKVGKIISYKTIPRPDEEIEFLLKEFNKNLKIHNQNKTENKEVINKE